MRITSRLSGRMSAFKELSFSSPPTITRRPSSSLPSPRPWNWSLISTATSASLLPRTRVRRATPRISLPPLVGLRRVDPRGELVVRWAVAAGQVALAHPRLEDQFQGERPQGLGCLGETAAEHPQQIEDVIARDARFTGHEDPVGGLQLGLRIEGLVGLGDRQAHSVTGRHEEVELDAAEL